MGYNNSFVRLKVRSKISELFINIIEDIPSPYFKTRTTALVIRQNNALISYEDFYRIVYRCALEYIQNEGESSLVTVVKRFPKVIKNVKRINENKKIIELQKNILNDYFYVHGEKNLQDKINELKVQIDELIEVGEVEYLNSVLENFEDRIRSGFLKDMQKLSQLLENR